MALKVKANNASRARNRLIGIFIALALIVFVCVMTAISSAETRKVITVVRIKQDAALAANAIINDAAVEPYDMYYKEFEQYGTMKFSDGTTRSTIVRWQDRDSVLNKRFSAYYQRGGTMLFWDSTVGDQSRKNSYLYSMSGELLNIKMTTTSEFGDMVVPGDRLNIRATYATTVYTLPNETQYLLAQNGTGNDQSLAGVEVTRTELLFSEVTILDMLNSSGNSIFDIYYDYISMSKDQQAAALKDSGFLASVKPSSILLECTSEEVERYMHLHNLSADYQMTLLPRTSSSQITDSLTEALTTERNF